MNTIYIAAFFSFVAGVFGYIIARFWVVPIGKYRKIKKQTADDVNRYLDLMSYEPQPPGDDRKAAAKSLRVDASLLADVFDLELPHWHRVILKNREESPVEASKILMKLSNTANQEHLQQQADAIRHFLQLRQP